MSATIALEGAHANEGYANLGGPKDGPELMMMSKRRHQKNTQIHSSKHATSCSSSSSAIVADI